VGLKIRFSNVAFFGFARVLPYMETSSDSGLRPEL
jgi:hypothetical protein